MPVTSKPRPRERRRPPHNGDVLSPEPKYAKLGEEVQRFDSLRALPIGLSEQARSQSCVALELTEQNQDWGSNDLLMSDVLRRNELQVWFVAEHIVDIPLVDEE